MKDRISTHPGRVQLTPVAGQANTYDLVRADEPIEVGSILNKANLLPDSVCDVLGLDRVTAEPKDAFAIAGAVSDGYGMIALRISAAGAMASGHIIVCDTAHAITNAAGIATLTVAAGNHTVHVLPALDAELSGDAIHTVKVPPGEIACINISVTPATSTEAVITSSRLLSFSGRVADFDLFAVGGGGGGGATTLTRAGTNYVAAVGGGGGHTTTALRVQPAPGVMEAQIGLGGAGGSVLEEGGRRGNDGGITQVTLLSDNSVVVSAAGGTGGETASSSGTAYEAGAPGGSGSAAASGGEDNTVRVSGSDGASGTSIGNTTGGAGQGYTTTAYAEGVGIKYAPAGGSCGGYHYNGNHYDKGCSLVMDGGSAATVQIGARATADESDIPGAGGGAATNLDRYHGAQAADGTCGLLCVRWRYK